MCEFASWDDSPVTEPLCWVSGDGVDPVSGLEVEKLGNGLRSDRGFLWRVGQNSRDVRIFRVLCETIRGIRPVLSRPCCAPGRARSTRPRGHGPRYWMAGQLSS